VLLVLDQGEGLLMPGGGPGSRPVFGANLGISITQ